MATRDLRDELVWELDRHGMTLAVPSATLVTSVTRVTPGQPPWLPTLPTPWVAGERDPKVLADLARGSMRGKTARLEEAFTGRFTDHHAFLLRTMLARIDGITADIDVVQDRIDEQIAPFAAAVTQLDELTSRPAAVQLGMPGTNRAQ